MRLMRLPYFPEAYPHSRARGRAEQAKRADRDKDESDTKVGGVLKLFEFDIKVGRGGFRKLLNCTFSRTRA